jgi:hypothetical protein
MMKMNAPVQRFSYEKAKNELKKEGSGSTTSLYILLAVMLTPTNT